MRRLEEPTRTWVSVVYRAVENLQRRYSFNRGMLLTEGDLECHLFNELVNQKELEGFHESEQAKVFKEENIRSCLTSYVHSQVTWFKPYKKSGFEVDLTIGDPNLFQIRDAVAITDFPSKGFYYDGPSIAIELKFLRSMNRVSTQAHHDFLKLIRDLIPAKVKNINTKDGYKEAKEENIFFFSIVACKGNDVFDKAVEYIGKHLLLRKESDHYDSIGVIVFSDEKIITSKDYLIEHYRSKMQRSNNQN